MREGGTGRGGERRCAGIFRRASCVRKRRRRCALPAQYKWVAEHFVLRWQAERDTAFGGVHAICGDPSGVCWPLAAERHRRRLTGGKRAAASAAAGVARVRGRAPTGHRRKIVGAVDGNFFSDAPPGQPRFRGVDRGLHSLTLAGPRLISCGVPPGPRLVRTKAPSSLRFAGAVKRVPGYFVLWRSQQKCPCAKLDSARQSDFRLAKSKPRVHTN